MPIWICKPLEICAQSCDSMHNSFGLLLKWVDRLGFKHTWPMPIRLTHVFNGGGAIAGQLADAGLVCSTSKQGHELLRTLLGTIRVNRWVRCVEKAGWSGDAYILPDGQTFGPHKDGVVLQSENAIATSQSYEACGTLEEWQNQIARYAVGNPFMALAICAGFAAPLLTPTNSESGGLHLHGVSKTGKTIIARCAASIYGPGDKTGPMRSWRATSNGLEGVAAATNDGLLVLDEMGEVDGREVGNVVYMLSNEGGKSRANRAGGARRRYTWKTLFLSTGEITLEAKMGEAGRAINAGQDVRLIGISADAGAGLGVWNKLHDKPSAEALSDHLRVAAVTCFGTAGPAFLDRLTKDQTDNPKLLASAIDDLRKRFLSKALPKEADGQVHVAAARFGLLAAAGELAASYGVLPWPANEATRAAIACFNRWLDERGHGGPAEDARAVEAVAAFIGSFGLSRFEDAGDPEQRPVNNRAGFRRRSTSDSASWEYLVLPSVWKSEVCKGLNPSLVAKALFNRGLLLGWTQKHPADQVKVPGYTNPLRLYRVSAAILGGADG